MNTALRHIIARVPDAAILLRREARWLVTLMLGFAAIWAFGMIADEVAENETRTFDVQVLHFFRAQGDLSDPIGPGWVEQSANDITALGGYPVLTLFTLITVGYLLLIRRGGAAALVVAAVGGGMVISQGLKALFDRARPDLVPHLVDVHTLSFPSGHSTLSAVTYLTLGALIAAVQPGRRVKAYVIGVALTLAVLVGVSRVYLGVHWPTDVLAGWSVGAAWALLCRAVAEGLMRRRKMRGERQAPTPS
ncbi:PA-phosphatase related phosphoesterase [Caenispirillum salinarum AK4]|uniref:PA-phosphatase related phosphoesterase n=1 Tax=Caenispirillum salinarum AK4 TaxID=1238182 RepID=K9H943_9PROT|nr:phosphatase PAP2 family protein [Caenispirillum salinarum]EKV27103.1 PA-phosphatase related phosphoesterase [Caenispirillum salinarum AK4]